MALAAATLSALPALAADWLQLESAHFTVTTNGPEEQSRSYLEKLEAFRTMSMNLLGADANSARAQAKFNIFLLRRRFSLKKVRPEFSENVVGVYCNCVEGSTAYTTMEDALQRHDIDTALEHLFHEYAHHLMFQYGRIGYPNWYVEGFAEFLATAIIQKDNILLGQISVDRAGYLKYGDWLPFKKMLASNSYFGSRNSNAVEGAAFYAQSWLLAHYMLTDSERAKGFNAYFERLSAGEDALAAFEPATGIPLDSLQSRLRTYSYEMQAYRLTLPPQASPVISVKKLADGADDYVLLASVLKTCPTEAHGKTVLAQLRTRAANEPAQPDELRLALARAEILYGDTTAAMKSLETPLPEEASFELHYLRGRALMKTAEGLQGEAAKEPISQAGKEFLAAYRLKKIDAANLFFLAKSLSVDGIGNNALNAARGARALAPSVAPYAAQEALMDLQVDDRERAARALLPLTFDPHQPEQAVRVRRAIDAIKANASTQDVDRILQGQDAAKP